MLWKIMLASSAASNLEDGGTGSFGELVMMYGLHRIVTQETSIQTFMGNPVNGSQKMLLE
jgi:hypothetical protein